MQLILDHRAAVRRPSSMPVVADYDPHKANGTWWENFEVRLEDLADGGCRFACTHPVEPGAHVRFIVTPPGDPTPRDEDAPAAPAATTFDVQGDIVWVRAPAFLPFGRYHAGVAFRPALQHGIDRLLARTFSPGTP